MLNVLTQSDSVDVRDFVRRIVEFDIGDLRRKLAVAQIVEIVALRVPRRVRFIEALVGDATQLLSFALQT